MNQHELSEVALTPIQREQMAGLIEQIKATRMVAENFISYFAKELGVNLQLYQFDADSLCFMPVQRFTPPAQSERENGAEEIVANGKVEAI